MTGKVRLNFNTIFARILFFNILLVLVATALPQGLYINYFKSIYDGEINEHNMQRVKQVQSSIDGFVLERVISMANTYFTPIQSNADLRLGLDRDISKNPTSIINITRKLADIKLTQNFIDSIYIYFPKSNLIVSDSYSFFADDEKYKSREEITVFNTIKNSKANSIWVPTRMFNRDDNRYVATYLKKVSSYSSVEDSEAFIAINVKQNALGSYSGGLKSQGGDSFFIIDENGYVITHSDGVSTDLNMIQGEHISKILSSGNEGMFQTQIQGELYVISFEKSIYNDWRYISLISIGNFYKQSQDLNNFLLIICLATILISVAASIFITRRAHKPLGKIISSFLNVSRAISGEAGVSMESNEYKILSSTVNNIAFKIDELNSKLEENRPVIRHNAIMKLLEGRLNSEEDKNYNPDTRFYKDKVVCFVIKIYHDRELSLDNQMLISYSVIDQLQKENESFEIKAVLNYNNQVAGILNYEIEDELDPFVQEILSRIEGLLNSRFTIAFGNPYTTAEDKDISRSYREACECLAYTFLNHTQKVLYFGQLEIEMRKESGSLPRILDKLADSLRSGDESKIKFIVSSVIESVLSQEYRIEYCRNSLMELVFTIRTTLEDMGYEDIKIFGYDIREYYKSTETVEEYRNWIYEIVDTLLLVVNERKQGVNQDLDSNIKNYIEENIYKDISLEGMATDLHFNPNYLSKIFKIVMGQGFSDYVMEAKLQCAVSLLKDKKLSVKEISLKLGYNSPNYFIRIFKQKYAYTPKEYQRMMFE